MNFEKIPRLRIGDACQAGDGAHASIKRIEAGVPYLMARNIKDGKLDLAKISYISEADFEKHFKVTSRSVSRVRENDVVFGIIGSIGDAYIVKKHDRFGLSSSVAILRPDTSQLNPKYLYYWVLGEPFQTALYNIKGGVAQGYVSLEMIKSLPLSVPNLSVQGRIASILSAYDNLIENNTRRIEILEEMARRLYEEWFVHFRFPGHEEVSFKESELGEIPEGWEVKGLYDIAEVTYGHPFKAKQFNDQGEGLGAVRIRDIRDGQVKTYTTEEGKPKHIIENGDILVGMDGQFHMGKWAGGKAWLVQRVAMFRPALPMSRYLLYLTIERPIKHLEETIVGTTVAHLSAKDLKAMKVVVPDEAMLKMMADTLEPMYELEMRLKRKNANLRAQRDLLLPKLVSGEIDVSDIPMPDDKEVEAA